MPELRHGIEQGELRLRAGRGAAARAEALALGAQLARADEHRAEFVPFAGERAYLKASPLRGRASRRHALRAGLLRARVPRMAEYANLTWLRRAGFRAPQPLAAGVLWRGGAPRFQFLLTCAVPASVTLDVALAAAADDERGLLVDELAREVGRLHRLGFVHRDLFPRNLLVVEPVGGRRLVLIDCWAGGRGCQRRGPLYDLACLMLEGADLFTVAEQRRLLDGYLTERRAGIGLPQLVGGVVRRRDTLVRGLERDPRRLRGKPMPGPWPPAALTVRG
ncbi:lipopolysaccharide kinase InaA family protein [Engelhardtia mirabilis]|uniref:3-deoxy-D-manno-octulosonic-acid kinase n=1 Tax=Engelhardtia mirabilis TaxID=2528011 RepID=A0A518BGP6_9BACT|nr:3-deoxy-D-manno-octulosonic-acid kinase [Planctomycetes bacterium Pla133]QDV00478.1 3-deoxy-D-manno-octulosonic-acid kinase [Planctomycetes bacterium Pla86]